ncbi:hypothetical protein C8Q74DRAFT_1295755 [Fomes fomentarius]|nr:hypothetical protein C8Q74DRAFT_1295755 [Fomes fomentarius]
MSSANNTFGTASPPLEATGGQQPMGVSSIRGDKPQGVPDKQQRKEYFKNEGLNTSGAAEAREEDEGQKSEKLKVD